MYYMSRLVVENGEWEDEEGDKRYLAPELLQGRADFKSDIFSAGLIIYQVCSLFHEYAHVYVYRQTDRQTDTHTERERERERDYNEPTGPAWQRAGVAWSGIASGHTHKNIQTTHTYTQMIMNLRDLPGNGPEWHRLRETPPHQIVVPVITPEYADIAQVVTWMIHPDPDFRPSAASMIAENED